MDKMVIPFSPPDITDEEISEVVAALKSGWITTGPRVKKLENELADYLTVGHSDSNTPRCVCLNSQTACAEMALRLLCVGPGDEVIVPAYTYTASASVVCHVGAKLVLIDIQPNKTEMDYEKVEAAITEHTKAIIPVDLGGVPCDYATLFEIVERKKNLFHPSSPMQKAIGRIAIMADTAHALGATWHGRMVGSIADFSSFSFHAVKNFTTAEGGALCWRHIDGIKDDDIYHQLQLYSLHGQSKDALHKDEPGQWEYDIIGPWYKCNMTDVLAAIGLQQFERYPGLLKRRREIIEKYDNSFKPLGIEVLSHFTKDYSSSGHLYITRIPGITDQKRREVITQMASRGIACNVHYKPLPMFTAYKQLGFDIKNYPEAYRFYENEITLPLHTKLSDEQVKYVIDNFKEVVSQC